MPDETILYEETSELAAEDFIDVLKRSTLAERRPVDNLTCIKGMLQKADLILTARTESGQLVGVARSISDFHYCTYLSDLAVDMAYQGQGIGKRLIDLTRERTDENGLLILLAAPAAETYYPHIGMEQHNSCWIIRPSG